MVGCSYIIQMKMILGSARVKHPIHASLQGNIQEKVKFNAVKELQQLLKVTICKRYYYFGLSDEEILLCLVQDKRGKMLGYKVLKEEITKEVELPDILAPSMDMDVIKYTVNDGTRSLFIHLKGDSGIWKLKFLNQGIRNQWADMLGKKKRSEEIHKSISNGEIRVTELETTVRHCQSVQLQIKSKYSGNQMRPNQVESVINLEELQSELTVDHKMPEDSMKAKMVKMLNGSIERDRILDFLASTFSQLFDLIDKMKIHLKDSIEEKKNLTEKLIEMQKLLQKERIRNDRLSFEILQLQQPTQNHISSLLTEPISQEPSVAYSIINIQSERSISVQKCLQEIDKLVSVYQKNSLMVQSSIKSVIYAFVEYKSRISVNENRLSSH